MSMRAIQVSVYGGPEVLKLVNIPKSTPKTGEVLVRIHSSGVNPVDTYFRQEYFPQAPKIPFVTGLDGAGVVEEVGQGVTEFKKGDRVYVVGESSGTCADYTAAPVGNVALLSDKLSFAQGAAIGIPYYTAYKDLYILQGREVHILFKLSGVDVEPATSTSAHRMWKNESSCLFGHADLRETGNAAVQVAVANGQRVFGTAGTEEGLKLVKKLGADQVFNHREAGYTDKILEATGGKGVDVILEMLANVNLDKDLDIVAVRGRIVVVGSRGTVEINPRKTQVKEATIVGSNVLTRQNVREWNEIKAGVQAGQKVGWLVPVVAKEYRLEDVAQAHKDIINNSGTLGKLVVDVAGK